MKVSASTIFALFALASSSAHAFTMSTSSASVTCRMMSSEAVVAEPATTADEAVMEEEEAPAPSAPVSLSGLRITDVRKAVSTIQKDTFMKTLDDLEPFLTKEAGATIYAKSMKRLAVKAKQFGLEMPEGYALEAKATQKRREKQHAFIQAKEEERLAAEAEAAEAAAAEAQGEEEEATSANDDESTEEAVEEAAPVEA